MKKITAHSVLHSLDHYLYNPRLHLDDGTAPYTYSYIQNVCLVVRMKKKSQHTASPRRHLVQHAYPDDGTALRDQGELEFVQATRSPSTASTPCGSATTLE